MISVFNKDNTDFSSNGNAILQPTECTVRMVAGGNYELTMNHPMKTTREEWDERWKHLTPGAIIRAPIPEETIEPAISGYDAYVYKTTAEAKLLEEPNEPQTINYPAWGFVNIQVGTKVTYGGRNWKCLYWDPASRQAGVPPGQNSWWQEIPRMTSGAAVLATLPAGTELYLVEDVDSTWYKMATYYGVIGYIKKSQVVFVKHLTPAEIKPRIIKEQLFRIVNATVDTKNNHVSVTAQHVSYDLSGILVKDVKITQASPAMAIGRIMEGLMIEYPGTVATNLTSDDNGTYTDEIKGKNGTFCLMDPDKGVLSKFNAALKRDNWDIFILQKTDPNRGFRLKYGKNLMGVNWARKSDAVITRVVPVAKNENGDNLYLPEKWIDSPLISQYPVIRMEQLGVKGQVGKAKDQDENNTWTENDLLSEMRTKAGERYSIDHADQIAVDVTVDFKMLGDTAEYRDIRGLEKVLLYDVVTVENEEIGLNIQMNVTELEWDAIRETVTAIKISNRPDKGGKNVTGYNVQPRSIGSDKLADEVTNDIMRQVQDIVPEYADPEAERKSNNIQSEDFTATSDSSGWISVPGKTNFRVLNVAAKSGGDSTIWAMASNNTKALYTDMEGEIKASTQGNFTATYIKT